jgi:hypothetical protein
MLLCGLILLSEQADGRQRMLLFGGRYAVGCLTAWGMVVTVKGKYRELTGTATWKMDAHH